MYRIALVLSLIPLAAFADPPAGKRYALLVGCNAYRNRNLPDLSFAERDATDLAAELKATQFETVVLLGSGEGDRRATKANIEAAFAGLLAKVGKHDTLLVAFAGHGVQFAKGGGKEQAYFCPTGAEVDDPTTLVALADLVHQLGRRGAGTNLILVDACRNDPDPNRSGVDGNAFQALPEGTAVLFSCSRGQKAYESQKVNHGVFFHFVLEGLKGAARNDDGEITWDRLVVYVKERVAKHLKSLLNGPGTQTPHGLSNLAASPVLRIVATRWAELLDRGLALQRGAGVAKDEVAAAQLIREAAEGGYSAAQVEYGNALYYGSGVAKDPPAALTWYRKAADQGDGLGEYYVGWAYLYAECAMARDTNEAAKWFARSAAKGIGRAMYDLGRLHLTGDGVGKDPKRAVELLLRAANASPTAAFHLGKCYLDGTGVEADPVEAAKWFRASADRGFAEGQREYGHCLYYGRGVAKNEAESMVWYRKAADQGHADAQNDLGWMYEYGSNPDDAEAAKWYRAAADRKHTHGEFNLARFYRAGRGGLAKDLATAATLTKRSADQGYASAENLMGHLYWGGEGVPQDEAEAAKWYRKAADRGLADGQYNIGWMYEMGRGVPQNGAAALAWYRKAADQGHDEAKAALKKLGG